MSKPYRLVVFDWEGTIGDTLGQIIKSVANEARRLNLGELDEQVARQSVDLGLVNAIKKNFPQLQLSEQEQLLRAVHQSLLVRSPCVYLIPGAKDFIMRLHHAGVQLAIASNKGAQYLLRDMHHCGLDQYFKITRSAGQTLPKPDPEMLEQILELAEVEASQALMIGDSTTDIEMAKSIGVDAIGIDIDHQNTTALQAAGALAVFDDYQRLAIYLDLPG